MRWILISLLAAAPLAASSNLARPSLELTISKARAEAIQAEAEARRLSIAAGQARGDAARLAAERLAAAAAIAALEARISEMDASLGLRVALVRANEARLAEKQAPIASLVSGLVNLGRRPPLISLADDPDLTQMVRMRALLDVALPHIRTSSAALTAELAASRQVADEARTARRAIATASAVLAKRQQEFAALETRSLERAARLDARALGADDRMLATGEGVSALDNQWERDRAARRLGRELALLPGAQRRPFAADSPAPAPPFALRLPVDAPVIGGMGQVSDSGVRSRGISFATRAGMTVRAPADGVIVFAGPFRRHDGIVIVDHGAGWMSLLVGVRPTLRKSARVVLGEPLGHALGPVTLELSINGQPRSAAFVAAQSQSLSIKAKAG